MTDIVSPPTINALPPAPQPADTPAEFDGKAFALLAAQVAMVGDFNSAAAATQQNATAANERAVAAASSASAANGSASTASIQAGVASGAATTATDKAAEATASALSASKLNLGPKAVAPVVDNQGAALLAGATYYDTALGRWRVWSGAAWADGISAVAGVSSLNGEAGALVKTTVAGYGIVDAVTLTGAQTLSAKTVTGLKETKVAMAANNIDLSAGNLFTKTISGATTLTVSNVPAAGAAATFMLDLTNGGSAAITYWSGVKWAGGTAPTLTAAGRDVLGFYTHDGGTTWTGLVLAKDVK